MKSKIKVVILSKDQKIKVGNMLGELLSLPSDTYIYLEYTNVNNEETIELVAEYENE